MLSVEHTKSIIEDAFLPLGCDTIVNSYERTIAYSVAGTTDETIERMTPFNLTLARNEPFLRATLSLVRERVEDKGHELLPWS